MIIYADPSYIVYLPTQPRGVMIEEPEYDRHYHRSAAWRAALEHPLLIENTQQKELYELGREVERALSYNRLVCNVPHMIYVGPGKEPKTMNVNVTRATITISAAELEKMILDAAKEQFLDEYELYEGEELDAEVLSAVNDVQVSIDIRTDSFMDPDDGEDFPAFDEFGDFDDFGEPGPR